MTKKSMINQICKMFAIKQSNEKAKWVYYQLIRMNKSQVEHQYNNFIINDGITVR